MWLHLTYLPVICSSSGRSCTRPVKKTTAVSIVSSHVLDARKLRSQRMTCTHVKNLCSLCSKGTLWQQAARRRGIVHNIPDWEHYATNIMHTRSYKEVNQDLLKSVAQKVVKEFTVIPEALLGEPVVDNRDHVYRYARVLCHFASLVLQGRRRWACTSTVEDHDAPLPFWKEDKVRTWGTEAAVSSCYSTAIPLSSADLGPLRQYSRSHVISTTSTSTSCSKI